jgi:hypothetical protein
VVLLVVGYPPTVAGAAAELPVETDAPHSLEEESLRTPPMEKLTLGVGRVNTVGEPECRNDERLATDRVALATI